MSTDNNPICTFWAENHPTASLKIFQHMPNMHTLFGFSHCVNGIFFIGIWPCSVAGFPQVLHSVSVSTCCRRKFYFKTNSVYDNQNCWSKTVLGLLGFAANIDIIELATRKVISTKMSLKMLRMLTRNDDDIDGCNPTSRNRRSSNFWLIWPALRSLTDGLIWLIQSHSQCRFI